MSMAACSLRIVQRDGYAGTEVHHVVLELGEGNLKAHRL